MIPTYGLLALAVLALWLGGPGAAPWRRWAWLFLLGAAASAGFVAGFLQPAGVAWLTLLTLALFAFRRPQLPLWGTVIAALAIIALALGLMIHWLPGFNNPRVLQAVTFSPDAMPFTLFLNFDKAAAGLLLIGWTQDRINRTSEWGRMFRGAWLATVATVAVILLLSMLAGYVRFDPKVPAAAGLWLGVNLLFTCMAEEAMFRGFVQGQLQRLLPSEGGGAWLAIILGAGLFGLAHAPGGPTYVGLAAVAGLGYGWIYFRTQRIEASILAHFTVNVLHFFLFTYPALRR
ncbi:MAG: CPBP family intramembrane metalloprotease [Verrucomicrobia bacterium]|nr:CPBP family intramembrane metalloprotease [Verrucomicrobiota bacterium]